VGPKESKPLLVVSKAVRERKKHNMIEGSQTSNFRQYGQMEKQDGKAEAQRTKEERRSEKRKSEERRSRCPKR
jgi:hypothetical protein